MNRGRRARRLRSLVALVVAPLACAVAAGPATAADFTWSGASTAADWSAAGNWAGGTAPSGAVGTLGFPALTGGACTAASSSSPPPSACYQSTNDTTGLSAGEISIDDGAGYAIGGNAITLGGGGITAAPSAADPALGAPSSTIDLPITLAVPQDWSINGGSADQGLVVAGALSGPLSDPLGIQLNGETGLTLADAEVGPVTVTGDGAIGDGFVKLGLADPASGSLVPGSLNATDGEPVRLAAGGGVLGLEGNVGPVTTAGGAIQVGEPDRAGTLAVAGDVTLDPLGALVAFINQPGTAVGSDSSELTASGTVDLAGAALGLDDGEAAGGTACVQLEPGDVDTLISAAGGITGSFAGVPEGTTVTLDCLGSTGTSPTARIDYSPYAVTATVESAGTPGAPTTTTLAALPSQPVTNQPVTLTATVAPASGAPAGSVEFTDGGSAIAGCAARPVGEQGGYYTATCEAGFAASGAADFAATFTPAGGSTLAASSSGALALSVARASTSTAVAVSPVSVGPGQQATYTAAVTPGQPGATEPSGAVDFLADGQPIAGCTGIPLSAGTASSGAVCRAALGAPGVTSLDAVTARYDGDPNFAGSTSPPRTITLAAAPPAAPPKAVPSRIGRAIVGRASVTATIVDVVVRCTGTKGQSCSVSLRLTYKPKTTGRTVVAGTRSVTLAAGVGETVHVELDAAGRRALARARTLPVTLTSTQQASGVTYRPSSQRLTFKDASGR